MATGIGSRGFAPPGARRLGADALRRGALPIAFALLVAVAGSAAAHALLDRASPAAGSTVHGSPHEVVLTFSEELEPAFCRLQVDDAQGRRVDRGDVRVAPADATMLEVSLPVLPAGRYRVAWRAVSVDTHVTEGAFDFDVRP